MRRIVLGIMALLCAQAASAEQHVLQNRALCAVVDLETGGIAQLLDLRDAVSPAVFGAGEAVLRPAAGAFRPAPFSVTIGALSSVTIVSPEFLYQGGRLPLRTTIEYRLEDNRIAATYRFEALDRVALDGGLDIDIESSAWDSLIVRNHFAGEPPAAFGIQRWIVRYFALNQVYELHNSRRHLSLVFPNPYHSLVTVTMSGSRLFSFAWNVLAAYAPFQAVEPKGPPLASVLPGGTSLYRQIELVVDSRDVPSASATAPVAYFSPYPNGYDQVIAMTFDDIPFGRYVWPISGYDPSAPVEQYLVRLLEDHPNMLMGWVVLPDAIFAATDIVDVDYPRGKWWRAHGTHRMLTAAPSAYLRWLCSLGTDDALFGYENRIRLGSHGYHHTPEMLFGSNYEFQSYDRTASDSTFAAIANEFSLLGLGARLPRWIRFPGFYFTRATVESLIANGYTFFDYWGIYNHLPWMLFYSDSGRIWSAGTWWEGDTPSPYESMARILGAGKLCHTAGHPGRWFDGDPEAAYQQISAVFRQAEQDYPDLGYLFPDDVGVFASETYDIREIETDVSCEAVVVSFACAAPSGQTIMVEWPNGWPVPPLGFIDGEIAASVESRGRRLVVVLPALAGGSHSLRLPLDQCLVGARPAPPRTMSLYQNYPNPFNGGTVVSYDVARRARVDLSVFNLRGELVAVLVDREQAPGTYTAWWDGRDRAGKNAASGIYFYRLTAGGETRTAKMILIR